MSIPTGPDPIDRLRAADPVHALREAMIEVRREHPHPFYWAPFVLTGKFWHD